jgi:hypothetical protein
MRDLGFESVSLQRGVNREPEFRRRDPSVTRPTTRYPQLRAARVPHEVREVRCDWEPLLGSVISTGAGLRGDGGQFGKGAMTATRGSGPFHSRAGRP